MAIFSVRAQVISRSGGRSSVAAAAYRAGENIVNSYDRKRHNYTSIADRVVHAEILLPENAPKKYLNRSTLWNAVEAIEKSSRAQTAREIMFPLPRELDMGERRQLILEYAQNQFVNSGMIADVCIHDSGDGNPHAHIMLTLRGIDEAGKWMQKQKKIYLLDEKGNKQYNKETQTYQCKTVKMNNWDSKEFFEEWRKNWTAIVNDRLSDRGMDITIDHRSYKEQGIDKVPTVHLGAYPNQLEKQGIESEKGNYNRAVEKLNQLKQKYWDSVHDYTMNRDTNFDIKKNENDWTKQIKQFDFLIDRAKKNLKDELIAAAGSGDQNRKNIMQKWKGQIAALQKKRSGIADRLRDNRISLFSDYKQIKKEFEKAKILSSEDKVYDLAAKFDAIGKITFKELRKADEALKTAQKDYARAKYDLQFVGDDKRLDALKLFNDCKIHLVECEKEYAFAKSIYRTTDTPKATLEQPKENEQNQEKSALVPHDFKTIVEARHWTIDLLSKAEKKDVQQALYALKVEFIASIQLASKAENALHNMTDNLKAAYTNLNFYASKKKEYDAEKAEHGSLSKTIETIKSKIDQATPMQRISGKVAEWQKELKAASQQLLHSDDRLKSLEPLIKRIQPDIDIAKAEKIDSRWIVQEKTKIDERFNFQNEKLKGEYDAAMQVMGEKRIELVEKITLAKDQNVIDAEGHSLREVMLESSYENTKLERDQDMLRYMSKDDHARIVEDKDDRQQPRERSAIDKAFKAQSTVQSLIQKGLSIGEDNVR